MQGDQAEATVAKKVYDLSLQEQQMTFQQAELRLQAQIARLQEQVAQTQTRLVASTVTQEPGDRDA
jgi:division protein CdvB (Snf7/Vps24/ESCRT-III family)